MDREKRRHVGQANVAGQDWQYVGEILERIDAEKATASEDGEGDRGALTTVVASNEKKILALMPSYAQNAVDAERLCDQLSRSMV